MRIITILWVGLCLVGCSDALQDQHQPTPLPREIVDLGALITEDTPEKFWGKGFLNEMGYTESNEFNVIT